MSTAAVYVDASAVVKVFLDEPGSALATEAISAAGVLIGSRVLYPEVGAALHRRLRDEARAAALEAWEQLWSDFDVVEVDAPIAQHALGLAQFHGLSPLDAIHLASALRVPAVPMRFVTWDNALANAAHAVGLRTIPELERAAP